MTVPDPDLADAFKILYDGDDWEDDDDDFAAPSGDGQHATEVADDIEEVEADLTVSRSKYTRAQFAAAIDSLVHAGPSKRRHVYPSPSRPQTCYPSTSSPPQILASSVSSYEPFSPFPFLARLRTFQPSTYSPLLPDELSPVRAATQGWFVDGRNTLACRCGSKWSVDGVADISDLRVRAEVAKRLAQGLVGRHKSSCAWKVQPSPDKLHSELRNLLHPPIASSLGPLASALDRDCDSLAKVQTTTPLNDDQLQHLSSVLSRYTLDPHPPDKENTNPSASISLPAASLALFAWYPYVPSSPVSLPLFPPSQPIDIVCCRLCERRVGLWAFKSESGGRLFDVEGEHLSWCPVRGKWWEGMEVFKGPKGKGKSELSRETVKGLITISERPAKRWRKG